MHTDRMSDLIGTQRLILFRYRANFWWEWTNPAV